MRVCARAGMHAFEEGDIVLRVCLQVGCGAYRGIKLMSHTMKLWERMIEARLREITNIADNQFEFRPGKSTTEPIFALRMLQEKYREKNKELHMVFVDLEKGIRSSTQRANMVEPTKENSSRSIH